MTGSFDGLSVEALRTLVDALDTGRLRAYDASALASFVPAVEVARVAAALSEARSLAMTPAQIAHMLRLLGREREAKRAARDDIELVWTGPEVGGNQTRDTQVVVRELFEHAERSVLIASYRVYQWAQVFGALVRRMEARPELAVQLFLHVDPPNDGETEGATLDRFAREFRQHWSGTRLPRVFYDPRTLRPEKSARASLHAKCIVVDGRRVFVSSANFTEAAHERNIEAGIALHDATLANALSAQFETLVAARAMLAVPGLG